MARSAALRRCIPGGTKLEVHVIGMHKFFE
jgi:hypothetical protein